MRARWGGIRLGCPGTLAASPAVCLGLVPVDVSNGLAFVVPQILSGVAQATGGQQTPWIARGEIVGKMPVF